MSRSFGNAKEVKALSKNIRKAVKGKDTLHNSYSPPTVLRCGAKEVMNSVLHTTPIGEDGSNWWGQDKYYPMDKLLSDFRTNLNLVSNFACDSVLEPR